MVKLGFDIHKVDSAIALQVLNSFSTTAFWFWRNTPVGFSRNDTINNIREIIKDRITERIKLQ